MGDTVVTGVAADPADRIRPVHLRRVAAVVRVLLGLAAVAAGLLLAALLWRHHLTDTRRGGPARVRDFHAAIWVLRAYSLNLLVLPLLLVPFLLWFAGARALAGRLAGASFRHGPQWRVIGWFVPGVNLVYPYQAATDLLRAARPGRRRDPLLPAWWVSFLLMLALGLLPEALIATGLVPSVLPGSTGRLGLDLGYAAAALVAAVTAALVVRRITAAVAADEPQPA